MCKVIELDAGIYIEKTDNPPLLTCYYSTRLPFTSGNLNKPSSFDK